MQDTTSNNKRIAKNTIMLYIRMFISMLVGLYTSRVVLATLGVEDYGIYGVVGGVVGAHVQHPGGSYPADDGLGGAAVAGQHPTHPPTCSPRSRRVWPL